MEHLAVFGVLLVVVQFGLALLAADFITQHELGKLDKYKRYTVEYAGLYLLQCGLYV